MKTKGIIFTTIAAMAMAVGVGNGSGATSEVSGLLQKGLFEEEANRNLDAAILAYQAVVAQTDKDRQFAATAIFRLGECYRKQGKISEANAQYQRIVREFADQKELATLSRQQLGGAAAQPASATPAEPPPGKTLTAAQISDIKKMTPEKRRIAVQQMFPNPVLNALMEKMAATEQDLAVALHDYGKGNNAVTRKEALLKTICQQVDDQVDGVLSQQANAANTAQAPGKETAAPSQTRAEVEAKFAAARKKSQADAEAEFIKRIQTMIKDSPDLINAPDTQFFSKTPLAEAVETHALTVAAFLLDNKADTEVRDNRGLTPLLFAAQNGDNEMVELLARRGADINAADDREFEGFGALHFASDRGDKAMVEVLLNHGAKVDLQASAGVTPLMVAARKGYKTVAETLLAKDANINAKDGYGNTALAAAIRAGNKAIAEWLLANKADPNSKDRDGKTPMFIAINSANKATIELLLANGANINTAANDGKTPLLATVENGNLSMVELLLSNKANPNLCQPDGFSPLLAAVNARKIQIVQSLLKDGADVNTKLADNHPSTPRWTPLDAAVSLDNGDLLKLLLDHHADPNARFDLADRGNIYERDCTPLIFAARRRFLEVAKILLEHGADANLKEKSGAAALLVTKDSKDRAMASLLLENKADAGMKYFEGRTMLHYAALDENQEFAGLLLDHGAPANAGDDYGKTPLHLAVEKNSQLLVDLLLAHGADVNAKDKEGDTPLDLRVKNNNGIGTFPVAGNGTVPLSYQWNFGQPDTGAAQAPDPVASVLRQHGGVAEVDVATIRVMRIGQTRPQTIFHKDAAGYNRHTLYELATYVGDGMLKFPDFSRLRIFHLPENSRTNVEAIDISKALADGDCSKDVALKWGDIVEVPETDHKVTENFGGLPQSVKDNLEKCLTREISIVVKGQTTRMRLAPNNGGLAWQLPPGGRVQLPMLQRPPSSPGNPQFQLPSFWLDTVVDSANVVLASSDLTRVKVKRTDPRSGKKSELVFNLQKREPNTDLWLEDGDVIEIPEKSGD